MADNEEGRIHLPPSPSTPWEAPWREVEEVISGLKGLTQKLDLLISLYTGVPVAPPVIVTPPAIPPPPTIIIPPAIPAPPPLPPLLDGRLDALVSYLNIPIEWGVATGGSKNRLTHMGKAWENNIWAGFQLAIVDGEGAGQVRRIGSNDRTSLTPTSDFDINPDRSSVYVIRYLPTSFFEPKSAYDSSSSAALSVDLDTGLYGGRINVEVWVKSSAGATFTVYGSTDNTNWRSFDTITLSAAGEDHASYRNAYRYIRVATTDANDNEIEIAASR